MTCPPPVRIATTTVVTIEHWHHERYGEHYSIMFGGKALLTFESELEAHRKCREHGWVVEGAS